LGVVEKEAVDWTIAASDEALGEAVDIEALDACFPAVSTADEFYKCVWVVGVEIDYLFVFNGAFLEMSGGMYLFVKTLI